MKSLRKTVTMHTSERVGFVNLTPEVRRRCGRAAFEKACVS